MRNKQISINLITNLIAMLLTLGINFIITPILVDELGLSAYGYIGLIMNLISFFNILTYTLTSMTGRFYTISLNKQDFEEANQYISTALYSCIIIGVFLVPIGIIFKNNINFFIRIDSIFINDVKIAFTVSFITFILNLVLSVFSTGAYACNRLDISNNIKILACLVKIFILILLLKNIEAKIWFVSLASCIETIVAIILSYYSFKKLIPKVQFSPLKIRLNKLKELISSGMFNSLILMGTTLMTQVLLIVANRYLDSYLVGIYSTILILPNTLTNIASTISSAYSPTTLKIYATGSNESLIKFINKVVSTCGYIIGWPISIAAAMSVPIFYIWIGEDYSSYRYFIGFIMIHLVSNLAISQLNVVNQATNKLKLPALMSILIGIVSSGIAVYATNILQMGLWGIGIGSVIGLTLRNIIFMPIYIAIITKQRWFIFYKGIIKPQIISIIIYILGVTIESKLDIDNIIIVLILCSILSIAYAYLVFIFLEKGDKKSILKYIKNIIRKYSIA